jgi:RNA polymerase sigma-70 factor (ECF subfamily)
MSTHDVQTWTNTQDKLKAFVLRHTRDEATADDIIQDVFLKVHDRMDQLRETEKIVPWIFRITRNAITDHFRQQEKKRRASDVDWESERKPLNDCVSSCLLQMMGSLPAKYREALELTELKNLSQLELASELNISYSGAKSRVQRARQMLRERMDEAYHIRFDAYGNVVVCEDRIPCACPESN